MVSISVIMSSARDDYPIVGLSLVHMLKPTIDSLKLQSFKDFQFVFCDALFGYRPGLFEEDGMFDKKKLPFDVKHIPVEHNRLYNHRFWLDNRRWNVCGQLNSCIIHCSGELVVRIDDCCQFDSSYIQNIWNNYQTGLWVQSMHVRYLEGKPAILDEKYRKIGYEMNFSGGWDSNRDETLKKLYGENGLIRDSRYNTVVEKGGRMVGNIIPENWFYGYVSFTLDAALDINGFDERFDGQKSLEDTDFGSRLEMKGYRKNWVLDQRFGVIEHEHFGISEKVIDNGTKPIICNYILYNLNRKKGWYRANSEILDKKELKFVRKESLKAPCSPNGVSGYYDENCEGRLFDIWTKNQPIFDLREERKLYGL